MIQQAGVSVLYDILFVIFLVLSHGFVQCVFLMSHKIVVSLHSQAFLDDTKNGCVAD